ncbi:hypothetical protein FRC11_006251, partial [Ceratobasidium sp. 423]
EVKHERHGSRGDDTIQADDHYITTWTPEVKASIAHQLLQSQLAYLARLYSLDPAELL